MQLNTLKRNTKNKSIRRVGRGGKHAKTSGRGTKGQNARAGHKKRPEIRDFIKRLPKMRGRGKNLNTSIVKKPTIVSLSKLNEIYKKGETVKYESLVKTGLVSKGNKVKILANGTVDKSLTISGLSVSAKVKEAVEKTGGKIIE